MPAMPHSVADDLQSHRPRRRPERQIGVIETEAVRWTDALWTYDVRLEATGRLLRRVREHVPPYYQSGAGLRQIGDRVSLLRLSRTLWEIVADESTPDNWGAASLPDHVVYERNDVREAISATDTRRTETSRVLIFPEWAEVRARLIAERDAERLTTKLSLDPLLGSSLVYYHFAAPADDDWYGIDLRPFPGLRFGSLDPASYDAQELSLQMVDFRVDPPTHQRVTLHREDGITLDHTLASGQKGEVHITDEMVTSVIHDAGGALINEVTQTPTQIKLALGSSGQTEILMTETAVTLTAQDTVITVDDGGLEIADPGGGVSGDGVIALAALPGSVDAELTHQDTSRRTDGATDPTGRTHRHSYDDRSLQVGRIYLRRTGAHAIPIQDSPSIHVDG